MIFVWASGDAQAETNTNNAEAAAAVIQEPITGDMPFSTAGRETEPQAEEYPHIFSTDDWNPLSFWYTNRPNLLNQEVDEDWDAMKLINTDRPDFTDVATVVGRGVTQVETGWTYRYHNDPQLAFHQHTLPESLLRVGVNDRFEWRMKWEGYANARIVDPVSGLHDNVQGVSDLQLGFKWIVRDQDDWRPLQTVVTRFFVPTGSSHFSADAVQPGFTYIYNWQVRKWWFIRGASGVDWLNRPGPVFTSVIGSGNPRVSDGRDYQVQGHQSVSSYMQISRRLGMFAEWFVLYRGASADNRPDHYHDYGLYLYLTPNLQLDARIGQHLGNRLHEYFTGAGLSFRF